MKYRKLMSLIEEGIIESVYSDGNFDITIKELKDRLSISVQRDGEIKLDNLKINTENDTAYFMDTVNKVVSKLLLQKIDNLIEEMDS